MAASSFRRFFLLLWKNYLLQKRKVFVTALEILLPTIFALILIWIRRTVQATQVYNATTWPSFDPSQLPDINFQSWKLYYTPDTPVTHSVMADVRRQLGAGKISDVTAFSTEEQMVSAIMKNMESNATDDVLGGVVFSNWAHQEALTSALVPANLTYKIRLSASPRNAGGSNQPKFKIFGKDTRWMTTFQFPLFQTVGPREKSKVWGGLPGYMREGFLSIQYAVNQAITKLVAKKHTNATQWPDVLLRRMPYPPYNDDNFVIVVQSQLPLLIMLSFVFSALHIVKDVVHEKEHRIKETLKLMGLPNWMHWLAWFVKHLLFLTITVAIITAFFVIRAGPNGAVIGYSSPGVLFVFLLIYSMATISFCFLVSVFFNKARTGAAAGGILFFLTYIPYSFLQPRYSTLSWATKVSTSLFSNVAMAYGGQIFGMFEGTGAGVQWSTLNQTVSVDDNFTLLHVLLMLLLDTFIYGLITWYVEAVWPGEFGIPQSWYFPVMKSYWCGTVPKGEDAEELLAASSSTDSDFFEKDPVGLIPGISVKGLRKVFGRGDRAKVAVAGTSLNMYEGQITALLGHNGAGKTTTMNMLTGFMPPTSGTAFVNGYNIRRDIASVRDSLGLCPQHDVLFDSLTVEEHLIFFALVKGCTSAALKREVTNMLRAVGLISKSQAQAKTLSGGQKRKLSVAIALIGGSKVVILDEPTSGMDPSARRHLWDVLQRHRVGRTMVLTTHFMDEADLLGDRVAIMANGVIQCCGSSLFLKNKYGAGYHMVIVKLEHCDVDGITKLVQSFVPSASLESNISAELSYVLPAESASQFEAFFEQLESRRGELGIASYGVSVTTMEEVFLKVGEEQDQTLRETLQQTEAMMAGQPAEPLFNVDIVRCSGWRLLLKQFQALLIKRVLHTFRNLLVTSTQLFVPLFFTILGLIVIKTTPSPGDSPPRTLTLDGFSDNVLAYAASRYPERHSALPELLSPSVELLGQGSFPQSAAAAGVGAPSTSELLARAYAQQYANDPRTRLVYVDNATQDTTPPTLQDFLVDRGSDSLGTYVLKYIIAADFATQVGGKTGGNESHLVATGYFNDQAYHTPAVSLGALQTGILRFLSDGLNLTLTAINHPLPRTLKDKMNDELSFDFTGFTISFHVLFGLAFLTSSFVLFLIKERTTKAKHCQFVSGVEAGTFWASTFIWDMANYLLPVIALLIVFYGFGITAYIEGAHSAHILLLFIIYGWACLPFMYVLSFLFSVPSSGFVWLTMLNVLSGIGTVIAVKILQIPQLHSQDVGNVLKWIFLAILPNFNLGQGLEDYYTNYQYLNICTSPLAKFACSDLMKLDFPCCKKYCTKNCLDYTENYLSLEDGGIGRMLIFMYVQGCFYFGLIFLLESGLLRRCWYLMRQRRLPALSRSSSVHSLVQEDEDVLEERRRIANSSWEERAYSYTLVLSELTKYYGSLLAVDRLSFGIRRRQCFGLLGVNGAGKTTTFKMLTGDEAVSSGNAYLQGYDIKSDMKQVQQRLGYCPQFDALIDQLTGRETLTMYARIRGVASYQIPGMVEQVIRTLLLSEHADKLVKDYSGGNKRKLSAAIALVGDPPVIFLDEPTTGMDPVARRLLWDTLSRLRAAGTTLVLTSHSMEECEALCTQIAIMVNGQIKCFGSTQHLKTKFGKGFTLLARIGLPPGGSALNESEEDAMLPNVQPFMDFLESRFTGSVLKDMHQGLLHYHIADPKVSLAELFGTMERNRHRFHIEDYSVSQTTLEQVFINFARSQVEPLDSASAATRCQRCRRACAWCCCCSTCCCSPEGGAEDDQLHIVDHEVL